MRRALTRVRVTITNIRIHPRGLARQFMHRGYQVEVPILRPQPTSPREIISYNNRHRLREKVPKVTRSKDAIITFSAAMQSWTDDSK